MGSSLDLPFGRIIPQRGSSLQYPGLFDGADRLRLEDSEAEESISADSKRKHATRDRMAIWHFTYEFKIRLIAQPRLRAGCAYGRPGALGGDMGGKRLTSTGGGPNAQRRSYF